ncbi:uncharacterized protein LOC141538413 isoform X2 [Cotesia typhae]|uniref:uncharacterized protein LOC141538413 isoform X2 n=1 Tax=Cotesia typhae TaxID=2053667 RepID=UPI003D690A10
MKHSARVLKMGCKRSDLEKLAVDDVGCIIDPKIQKSYTKDVLDKKKELQNKKTKKTSAVSQKQNRSESLLKKASIFNSLKTQSPSELTSDAVDPLQNCTRSSDGESSSEDDKEDKENDTIANELESPPILSHEFMDGMRRIMCYFEGIHQRQNTSTNELQTNQVIKCINTASPNKVEIFEGSNCYIRKE